MSLLEQTCEHTVDRLSEDEITARFMEVDDGWNSSESGDCIERTFQLKNYSETLALVNIIAGIADQQDHHPDICFGYKQCKVSYSTHSAGGISINDFICAAHIDKATA